MMRPIIIAAAARTPWGKYQGQLASVSGWQLGQIAVEAAVKRSSIPLEQIQQIIMNEAPALEKESELIFSNFVNKAKYTSISGNDNETKMESYVRALEFLKSESQAAVVLGGLSSARQNGSAIHNRMDIVKTVSSSFMENYMSQSMPNYKKSQAEGAFDSELVPLTVQAAESKRGCRRKVSEDEIFSNSCIDNSGPFYYCDGAAALVLSTLDNAQKLDLSPLAVLTEFAYTKNISNVLSSSRECVEKLFSKVEPDPQKIRHWEIEDFYPQVVEFLQHHYDLNKDLINPHGGSLVLGYSPTISLIRLLTHITHSLNPLEYGCVISGSHQGSLALIIQKLPWPTTSNGLPLITLYTKNPCPLCDMLIEELELNFSGEYELEKVFIDNKDNLRFLRLYRFDIPVVFLNNQFLCMHRLNHRLLRKRLDLLTKYM